VVFVLKIYAGKALGIYGKSLYLRVKFVKKAFGKLFAQQVLLLIEKH